jgi:hypothetical protein
MRRTLKNTKIHATTIWHDSKNVTLSFLINLMAYIMENPPRSCLIGYPSFLDTQIRQEFVLLCDCIETTKVLFDTQIMHTVCPAEKLAGWHLYML